MTGLIEPCAKAMRSDGMTNGPDWCDFANSEAAPGVGAEANRSDGDAGDTNARERTSPPLRVDEASGRDTAEFEAHLLALAPALRRFALSLTRNGETADDLAQETLMRAWAARGRFQLGTDLKAWTFTILRNRFSSRSRKDAREVPDEDGAHAAPLSCLPEQDGHLDLADVQVALSRLTPRMREALVLVVIEDRDYDEAAALMNCRVGAVKSRVWRARMHLTALLGYAGAEIGADGVMLAALGSGRRKA